MKIGIYALAKNESANVAEWEASCRDADVRVVTDTGSTDGTIGMLEQLGVTVYRGAPVPWRWDDAHNLALMHLPADVDVAIRLDLDESLDPGWRDAVEAAWTPGTTGLRYPYHWSSEVVFMSDRIHARHGHRWVGATHEGLMRWVGEPVIAVTQAVAIRHRRDPAKRHASDMTLLLQAVKEMPGDARMQWYLAREYDMDDRKDEAIVEWKKYLALPGGAPHERSFAFRRLAALEPKKAQLHLLSSMLQNIDSPEPEPRLALATLAYEKGDMVSALYWGNLATICGENGRNHTSDAKAYGSLAPAIACSAAQSVGRYRDALKFARIAVAREPENAQYQTNLKVLESLATGAGPRPD